MEVFGNLFHNLMIGFGTAFSLQNLLFCFFGVFIGTFVGVLPGIGPIAAIAMLLPITYTLPAISALIMLAGIYYGTMYGSSTTSILVNLPGDAGSVITCLDGYQMARSGKAGPALAIAAIGSFFAGTVCTLLIAVVGPAMANIALEFGAAEYFSLMAMGLVVSAVLTSGSPLKGIAMILLGLLLGSVGIDVNSGVSRLTFGFPALVEGISFVVLAMGIFGLSEILSNLEKGKDTATRDLLSKKIDHLYPTANDLKQATGPILRGTALGAFLGILPGAGATMSSFSSYAIEKKISKHPEQFGKGAIPGVAGPEAANNAAAQCAFIPTLTLGIPGSGTMALMLGALIIQGITPGPTVVVRSPELFWGLITSMWIGNFMLLALNLPLIGIWVRLLQIPYRYLFPAIITFMAIGVYSVNNSAVDVYLLVFFGILGYLFMKLDCEPAPLILAFVLGPMMEENLRRAMVFSNGDLTVFFRKPISACFLAVTILLLISLIWPLIKKSKKKAF